MKTSDMNGPALCWAVAQAKGLFDLGIYHGFRVINGKLHFLSSTGDVFNDPFNPIENELQGARIIERECIKLEPPDKDHSEWSGYLSDEDDKGIGYWDGPTPLIAAMRCYVASKLGDEVEIPEQLLDA
jgi:hypothetical protein